MNDVRNILDKLENLNESLSAVVYHYAVYSDATKILKGGFFKLSTTAQNGVDAERRKEPTDYHLRKKYRYAMSFTRTKMGGFHRQREDYVGILFQFDGNALNQRYKATPISSYNVDRTPWHIDDREYPRDRGEESYSEAEDRLYTDKPTIPITYITAVHVFIDDVPLHKNWKDLPIDHENNQNKDSQKLYKLQIKLKLKALEKAKKFIELSYSRDIPVFFYRSMHDLSRGQNAVKNPKIKKIAPVDQNLKTWI